MLHRDQPVINQANTTYAMARRISFAAAVLLTTLCRNATAAEEAVEEEILAGGLAVIDWLIVVVYAASTIGLGWWFSRKQRTTDDYFTGGGKMNPILVGISLFATLLSTISYRSMPGEALGKGPGHMVSLLGLPIVFLIVGFVLLPVYMKHRVTSAYELLEKKLGLSIRILGATMFIALRLVWMSLLVYLTAEAMTIMFGIPEAKQDEWIPIIVLITGFVAVTYTSLGGLQAVVITDLMQTILLYGGALLVLATVSWNMGGFGWFPTEWQDNWDTQPIFPSGLSTRLSVVGTLLSTVIWYVATAGGDQTSVQRFMATKDASAARKSFATQMIVSVIVTITLGLVGFALLGYFRANPALLSASLDLKNNADDIFPHFIAFHLPPGVSGFVVAALFAAAMSSIDSGVNSITAVIQTDYLGRLRPEPQTEQQKFKTARILAFTIGAIVVVGSSQMGLIRGNITEVTGKTSNLLTTPIFGLFFFALFVPFAKPAGVWAGAIAGTATAILIAFCGDIFGVDPVTGLDPISFQWISPAAVVVNITVGILVSLAVGGNSKQSHSSHKSTTDESSS